MGEELGSVSRCLTLLLSRLRQNWMKAEASYLASVQSRSDCLLADWWRETLHILVIQEVSWVVGLSRAFLMNKRRAHRAARDCSKLGLGFVSH